MATTNILLFRNPSSVLYNILISSPRLVRFGSSPKGSLFTSIYLLHTTCSNNSKPNPGFFDEQKITMDMSSIKINEASFAIEKVYLDAETAKKEILSDNNNKAGIYLWTHLETGTLYIGSAVDLTKRLKVYLTQSYLKRYKTVYIYNALLCHGYSAFSLTIIEYIDITNLSKEEARKKILLCEQKYLDILFSVVNPNTYNILKVAGSLLGYKHAPETLTKISEGNKGKTHLAETKALISEAKKGELNPMFGITGENHPMFGRIGEKNPMFGKTGKNNPRFGQTLSSETKAKISEAHLGKPKSDVTKAKMSQARQGKNLSTETIAKMSVVKGGGTIYVYNLEGTIENSFTSARKAGLYFNVSQNTIIKYARNSLIFKDKWRLSYTEISSTD